MKISYKFCIDAAYYKCVVDRYHRQKPILFRLPVQFGILGLIVAVSLALVTNGSAGSDAIVPLLVGATVLVVGVFVTKMGILLRFKGKAAFGEEVAVIISDDGVEASGQHTQGKWQWAAYPRSVRFSDGILLMRAGTLRWLPDAAIQEGTAVNATALVESRTSLRRIA